MKRELSVLKRRSYGRFLYYPRCELGDFIIELLGNFKPRYVRDGRIYKKCFSEQELIVLQTMGFQIKVVEERKK
jgi:hypothetical protein